jgi:hypothetical protein
VIARSCLRANAPEVADEPAERCPIGQQNGEVVKPQSSPAGYRTRPRQLAELHQRSVISRRGEHRGRLGRIEQSESQHILVERDRAGQVGDL